jgi:hypothetical protein
VATVNLIGNIVRTVLADTFHPPARKKFMRQLLARTTLIALLLLSLLTVISAQEGRRRTRVQPPPPPPVQDPVDQPTPEPTPPDEQPTETIKIATDLVTVPIIATDINGLYVTDLRKEEFQIEEDGTKQEIAVFTTLSAPFHVVLMLDTSASTREKLVDIRRAANAFVDQLQSQDRVKVISFNDVVTDHNEFTNDRALLHAAINRTQAGEGTKLYDAFSTALDSIRTIQGRKAIVLFTDGVDRISDQATFDSTLRGLDEEGVIVYPIRYDTRAETEALVRQQAAEQSLPTIGVVRTPPAGTTAPTFPSDDPDSVPTSGSRPKTGPLGLPLPEEILRRRRQERDRRTGGDDRYPSPDRIPRDPPPPNDPTMNPSRYPAPSSGRGGRSSGDPRIDNSIRGMLDLAYEKADAYLKELEVRSGGRLLRADTLISLPDAFAKVAAELRTQYALGYYPTNKSKDGKYRKIKVTSSRKNVRVRARPGYIATDN